MIIPASIEQFLTESLGLEEDTSGKGAVIRAVTAVMKRGSIKDLPAYEKLFTSSIEERQKLIDEIVVGETWFFRDRGPFDYLAVHAQNLIKALQSGGILRVLSAPCSSGEEPYSIVMTLLQAGLPPTAFTVDAADISVRSLDTARKACYGRNAFREPLGTNYEPYFLKADQGKQVAEFVSRQVRFIQDNLTTSHGLQGCGPYHVIFCRNFLIYLTPEARQRVFKHMDRLLLPGGILFSGHSETVFWHQSGYRPLRQERAFAFSKPDLPVSTLSARPQKRKTPLMDPACLAHRSPKDGARPTAARAPLAATLQKVKEKEKIVSCPPENEETLSVAFWERRLREARMLADRGAMDEAVKLCRDYEKAAGPVAEAYCLMGLIHEAGNDVRLAEDYFLKALYLDPNHYETLVHTSLLYQQQGDARKATLYKERAERSKKEDREPKT